MRDLRLHAEDAVSQNRKVGTIPDPVDRIISASFVPSLLVGYRKVYSLRCEAHIVMTSAIRGGGDAFSEQV
jgi:hypothetical protein